MYHSLYNIFSTRLPIQPRFLELYVHYVIIMSLNTHAMFLALKTDQQTEQPGKGRTERLDLSHVHDRHLKGASDKNEHGELQTFGNKNMGKG